MIGLEGRQLHSTRLTLRLAVQQDKEALWQLLQDGTVTKPAGFLPITTAEEFDHFFSELIAYHTGVTILTGDVVIGYVRVNKEVLDQAEYAGKSIVSLGFVIGKPYQKQGYGTEMLQTMTGYLLDRFDYVVADHFVENDASRRLIEKCGYQFLDEYSMVFEHLDPEEKQLRSYIR